MHDTHDERLFLCLSYLGRGFVCPGHDPADGGDVPSALVLSSASSGALTCCCCPVRRDRDIASRCMRQPDVTPPARCFVLAHGLRESPEG